MLRQGVRRTNQVRSARLPEPLADGRFLVMTKPEPAALIVGASRGLGFALVEEYLKQGWSVVATERSGTNTPLQQLARASEGRLEVERVDINHPDHVEALRRRLQPRRFELLFVNAGVGIRESIANVSTDEFVRVMVNNALSPMRFVEAFREMVIDRGTIAVMSSGQGSISNNERGGYDVYRASKTALNPLMRSFAALHRDEARTLLPAASVQHLGTGHRRYDRDRIRRHQQPRHHHAVLEPPGPAVLRPDPRRAADPRSPRRPGWRGRRRLRGVTWSTP
jgi:NAD(P)-dependent dehydrogenase (short-subunit alcohol dehydrogenase family)